MENKKPTILLLSDDIRTTSGVATVSRKLIQGSINKYNCSLVFPMQRTLQVCVSLISGH